MQSLTKLVHINSGSKVNDGTRAEEYTGIESTKLLRKKGNENPQSFNETSSIFLTKKQGMGWVHNLFYTRINYSVLVEALGPTSLVLGNSKLRGWALKIVYRVTCIWLIFINKIFQPQSVSFHTNFLCHISPWEEWHWWGYSILSFFFLNLLQGSHEKICFNQRYLGHVSM